MPDTSAQGTIIAIVVILAIIGIIALRSWSVRFLTYLLTNAAGRTALGVLLCCGGLIFGFTSSTVAYQSVTQGSGSVLVPHVNTPDDGNIYVEDLDNFTVAYVIHDADFSPPVDGSVFQDGAGLALTSLVYDTTNTQQLTEQFGAANAGDLTGYTVKEFTLGTTTYTTADYQANPTGAFQNNWPVGGAIAGAGLLLLLITFGIPAMSKSWEQTAAEQRTAASQPWSSMPGQTPSASFFSPDTPNMQTPQPGGIMPMSMPQSSGSIPTPQPGGIMPAPNATEPPQSYPPQ